MLVPLLLFFGMGMAEFGQYFYIKNAFEKAAYDAARVAITPSALQGDPAATATRTLGYANVTFNSSWMTIMDVTGAPYLVSDVSAVSAGHALMVTIGTTYDQIPIVYRPLYKMTGQGIKNGKQVTSFCTMVKE